MIDVTSGGSFELAEISSIGRSRESLVPVADPRASRRHAMIRLQDRGFWFFDLGSRNGSYLNGKRVTTAQLLTEGDVIEIGSFKLRFEGTGPADSSATQSFSGQKTMVGIESREAIIFVCDILGFTTLSEKLGPDLLAPIIGSWYSKISLMLDENGASLDKFIGDCALAYWLDTSPGSRLDALRTVRAAERVAAEVEREHHQVLSRAGLTFRTGAAVHLGPVMYGAISEGAFTLLGDAVNLTFRLEALTREIGKPSLASGDFLAGWDIGKTWCEPCGSHHVKGRSGPVEVFSVEGSPG